VNGCFPLLWAAWHGAIDAAAGAGVFDPGRTLDTSRITVGTTSTTRVVTASAHSPRSAQQIHLGYPTRRSAIGAHVFCPRSHAGPPHGATTIWRLVDRNPSPLDYARDPRRIQPNGSPRPGRTPPTDGRSSPRVSQPPAHADDPGSNDYVVSSMLWSDRVPTATAPDRDRTLVIEP